MGQTASPTTMSEEIWEANTIRLTLFPVEPINPGLDIWRPLLGLEPDSEETRAKDGFKRQAGAWGTGNLDIQWTPARLDILLGPPAVEAETGQFLMPSLTYGPFLQQIDLFARPISAWIGNIPFSVYRVALSGNVLIERETREETYEILKKYIKSVKIDPKNMRELLYRVNWQRSSDIVGHLNDINFWSSVVFQGGVVPTGQTNSVVMQRKLFAQLQFDVSTPEDRKSDLEHSALSSIFDELLALAKEGVIHGERPL